MDQPRFVISAAEAESMAQSLGLPSVLHLLPALVQPAQELARPPISNYHVGAVGLGSDGRVFLGVNLEFPGFPLNQSVHAEQFLLTNLAVHRCPGIVALAVSAAPCGHCRQFLQELRNSSSLQLLITSEHPNLSPSALNQNLENSLPFKPLSEFLTSPFGPSDLLAEDSPLLLETHQNGLSLIGGEDDIHQSAENHAISRNGVTKGFDLDGEHKNLSNGFCHDSGKKDALLRIAALEAANLSHAPYSNCPSGVALMDCEGKVYRGSYIESAAYNPSLPPVQAALVGYIAGGGGGYERIVAAVLVEKVGAKVTHEDIARLFVKKISPKCEFRVFHCHSI
ncbi:OLC1v1037686C1 [Oldenlandia corymbosa var. corymbosa]|uniref:cytidine deaminase n=1 Tax=Oldenlandia corymbosa var. corymbosa TaxID=529605 RepID=A0AAV1D065_OLDCO|nr:OLC1v1037686C1 [Oldenlandia corymbosa var. corymbosa]